ncbi:serine carboxypeptidase-like [Senna tora]|uniref:Carboxypeptidase n=1 Tax=Senna tora TaxID=362788 RepID=A0A834WHA2_9FABA|nr:serine carboxypeptidase-like [Senna tora]
MASPSSSSSSMFLPKLLFVWVILISSPLFSSATCPSTKEKLIRELNLCPKHSINTVFGDPMNVFIPPGNIFEKKLIFPNFASPSGPSIQDLGHHAGYYSLPRSKSARMFYLFFEARNNKNDVPLVIWLTGGPGCSSELALFYENGPFHISKNLSLVWNDFGWDKASNIIFVDQPIGTGFSYSSDESDIPHDEEGVSNDLYDFLQAFLKEHPQFVKNEFYITGESYAGHYIPALASRVHKANKAKEGIYINLKGFAIGNGLTNPEIQYPAYTDFALQRGLIQKSDYDSINQKIPPCLESIKICAKQGGDACETSRGICIDIFESILYIAGNINYYDIRKQCEGSLCYDFSSVETLLNEKEVKEALGVGDLDFVSCSSKVYYNMLDDWMRNLEVPIPSLLQDGIRMLVYAGEEDLICNWLGNSRWVEAMEWSGQKDFKASPTVSFKVNGKEAGLMKSHGPLTFLQVHEAGHMVPMDQPEVALHMLTTWIQGNLTTTPS